MDHLLSLALESSKGPRVPHDAGSSPSDMHKHNPLSEKLTSMLGLPEEQMHKPQDSSHREKLSLPGNLLRRISGNTVESGQSSTHSDTASSVDGQHLTNKLIGAFHEVVAPSSSTDHDDRSDRPQWVGIATAAIGSIQHRTSESGHPGSTSITPPPGTSQSQGSHPNHHRLMDKLSSVFDGKELGQKEKIKAGGTDEGDKARHDHLPLDMFEKLGLGQPHDTIPPKSHEQSILERLGSTVYHASGGHPNDSKTGGISDKIQSALGGGSAAEANEDDLDKAIDFIQQHILHQGPQSHETVLEQMKDEQIARTIRAQYKQLTGREFPLKKGKKHFT